MAALTLDVGGPVHVVDHGGEGPPMVLVHGLGGSLIDWRDVAGPLSQTHHVWAVDLVGFGRTPLADRTASVETNQAVVDAVIEHAGGSEPAVLVGNSMGGLISIVEASRRPHRVRSLVLVDPALPMARGGRLTLMIAAAFMVMTTPHVGPLLVGGHNRLVGAERLVDNVLKLCTADPSRISPATRAAEVELTRWRQRQDEPNRAFLDASRSLVRWLWHRDIVERHIGRVTAPTLLIHGEEDNLVSVGAAATVAAQRPDWSFRVLVNTGHIPQLETPSAFVSIVEEWLGARQRGSPAAASRR